MVGEKVFSHESGLHADGVLKFPGNYEGYDPGEVGLNRHLVIGKHSGSHGLNARLLQVGIKLSQGDLSTFLGHVRNAAQVNKRPLSDTELIHLYRCNQRVA